VKQVTELAASLRRKALDKIAADDPATTDVALARRYIELLDQDKKPGDFYPSMSKEIAPILGQTTDGAAAVSCWGRRTGPLLRVDTVCFRDPAVGAPALVEWLKSHGIRSMRYEVESRPVYSGEVGRDDEGD